MRHALDDAVRNFRNSRSTASVVVAAATAALTVTVRTRPRQEQRRDSGKQSECKGRDNDGIRGADHSNGGAIKPCDANGPQAERQLRKTDGTPRVVREPVQQQLGDERVVHAERHSLHG